MVVRERPADTLSVRPGRLGGRARSGGTGPMQTNGRSAYQFVQAPMAVGFCVMGGSQARGRRTGSEGVLCRCQNIGGGPRFDSGPARAFLRSRGLVP